MAPDNNNTEPNLFANHALEVCHRTARRASFRATKAGRLKGQVFPQKERWWRRMKAEGEGTPRLRVHASSTKRRARTGAPTHHHFVTR